MCGPHLVQNNHSDKMNMSSKTVYLYSLHYVVSVGKYPAITLVYMCASFVAADSCLSVDALQAN